ncbi:MAG TPA: hypothetical protein VE131_01280, partial [Terriglobales bacterium]|nr:hypothetical protein [Terriglobales bacterium]
NSPKKKDQQAGAGDKKKDDAGDHEQASAPDKKRLLEWAVARLLPVPELLLEAPSYRACFEAPPALL